MDDDPSRLQQPDALSFDRLLERLDADRERAGEKYVILRRQLSAFFEADGCRPADDLADVTLDRLARRAAGGEVRDARAFAWGVARKVRLEARRQAARRARSGLALAEAVGSSDARGVERRLLEKIDNERLAHRLRAWLDRLPPRDRTLFLTYHWPSAKPASSRLALAAAAGLPIATLRVRIKRLRDRLGRCVPPPPGSSRADSPSGRAGASRS